MSSFGMLGLLEGIGRGATATGEAMQKNFLQQAEEQRQANLLNLKRQWDLKDKASDRTYEEGRHQTLRGEAKEDLGENRAYTEGQNDKNYTRERGDKVADTATEHAFQLEKEDRSQGNARSNLEYANTLKEGNQSEMQRRVADIEGFSNLTPEQKTAAINKAVGADRERTITEKDMIGFKVDAAKQAQKEAENSIDPKEKTPEAIDARARQIFRGLTGKQAEGGLLEGGEKKTTPDGAIRAKAEILAGKSPEEAQSIIDTQAKAGKVSLEDLSRIKSTSEAIRDKRAKDESERQREKEIRSKPVYDPKTGDDVETNPMRVEEQTRQKAIRDAENARKRAEERKRLDAADAERKKKIASGRLTED